MGLSRRSFAKMFAAAPFAARQAGQTMRFVGGGGLPPAGNLAHSLAGNAGASAQADCANAIAPRHHRQIMPEWQAQRLAKKVPHLLDLMRDEATRNNRYISYIDPDIDVHRSVSLAAKIVYQRQRNIERELDRIGEEPSWDRISKVGEWIRKTVWGD